MAGVTESIVEQAALADFIAEGHFASHIRRMRTLYMERRSVMIKTIRQDMGDILETWDSEAGMHSVGWLPPNVDDSLVSAQAAKAGIYSIPVSSLSMLPLSRGGLALGYAAFKPELIRRSLRDLEFVIRQAPSCSIRAQRKAARRLIA